MIDPVFLSGCAPETLNVGCYVFHFIVEEMLQFEFYLGEVNLWRSVVGFNSSVFPFGLFSSLVDLFLNPPSLGVVLEPKTVAKFAQSVNYLHAKVSPGLFQLKRSVWNVDWVSHILDQISSFLLQLFDYGSRQCFHLSVR